MNTNDKYMVPCRICGKKPKFDDFESVGGNFPDVVCLDSSNVHTKHHGVIKEYLKENKFKNEEEYWDYINNLPPMDVLE